MLPQPVPTPHKPWPAVLHVRSDALAAAAERATAPLCSPAAVFLAPAGPDSPAVLYGAQLSSLVCDFRPGPGNRDTWRACEQLSLDTQPGVYYQVS